MLELILSINYANQTRQNPTIAIGPMSLDVRDRAITLQAMAGPDRHGLCLYRDFLMNSLLGGTGNFETRTANYFDRTGNLIQTSGKPFLNERRTQQ